MPDFLPLNSLLPLLASSPFLSLSPWLNAALQLSQLFLGHSRLRVTPLSNQILDLDLNFVGEKKEKEREKQPYFVHLRRSHNGSSDISESH